MQRLLQEGWQLQPKALSDGPAKVLSHPDYQGEIGLIMPYEKNFCASCNRLRVSALGKLHLCLFGEEGINLRDLLSEDTQQAQLEARLKAALQGNGNITICISAIAAFGIISPQSAAKLQKSDEKRLLDRVPF
ncbi:molybdenum cofactor biosynthesis protein A [Actinobacillus equuli]|nr:molybdenum cofactor biosynthesis protein A [Actinobacillus equuli]